MIRVRFAIVWAAMLAGLTVPATTFAQSTENEELRRRVAELEQTVAAMRQPATVFAADPLDDVSPDATDRMPSCSNEPCGSDCSNACCVPACAPPCGPLVGAEYVALRPYSRTFDFNIPVAQFNFAPSYRVWLGWQRANGQGLRIRYWEFDQGASFEFVNLGLEFRTLDAELTQTIGNNVWSVLFSGGVRYGEARRSYDDGFFRNDFGFSGTGITGSVSGSRNLLSDDRLRFTATARLSTLVGNGRSHNDLFGLVEQTFRDQVTHVVELTIGPQSRFTLPNGATFFAGVGVESQYWTNTGAMPALFSNDSDMGLFGFAVNLGVAR